MANAIIFEPMKIAVNTRLLLHDKLEGIGWFTHEIFSRLSWEHPEVEWLLLFDRKPHPSYQYGANVKCLVVNPPARHPLLWYIWFEWSLPRIFRREKPDLFISPDGYLSLSATLPQIPVIHDINFEHFPANIPPASRRYYKHFFRKFARKATRIATVSHYSRGDISRSYGVDEQKIDVVYNGAGDFFEPQSEEISAEVRNRISGGAAYFIFIGAFNPRKNIDGMLHAYARYRESGGQCKFVLVGDKMYWRPEFEKLVHQHPYQKDLIFTGRLSGKNLNEVLAAARGLLFVSRFEGFGIPIVEAFQCEVPVITSTETSMPEVAGDAALLCHPDDHPAIAKSMHKLDNAECRRELIRKGRERSREFSWDRSAVQMWEIINKTL